MSDPDGKPVGGAGYCTIFDQDGDVLWVWFRNAGDGTGATWGVIGGTGKNAGATGGGTTSGPTSGTADGRAWVSTSSGSIIRK